MVPFQTEQQAIVEIAEIVRAIGIDDERVGQAGQFQQARQIGGGACQARDLQAKDGADLSQTDAADQISEAAAPFGGAT